ncbi:MAG: YqeG family HAD IIIA-type phosphatase [Clostridia bacterium]|nr:YqeG family HAD IIIA-type phosphatase [Clostridia bacterium]
MKVKNKPTYIFNRIEDIPFDLLEKNKIKGLFLDIDNTLMDFSKRMLPSVARWIKEAKKRGFTICLVSNTLSVNKVKTIMQDFDIYGLANAKKPTLKGFQMALNIVDLKKEQVIMIGDQMLTDILGANRFGIKSIYVRPISNKEWIGTMIKRPLDNLLLKIAK